ncbi:fibronectin type III domain-containing protein [Marinoscillum furvescens]|uniref:Fibronectin type III domain protein n=1 Tax=Marinoscillum furvescens DSM 4134 TaxID=1122208 RepID=A0A3D9L749_MARFU|nr:fibronectin type III domain-containing protein [Marinoscillum furvescens]REE00163.1 fibronectin type III domain protein [Marinoscillum furvescens DSM 4134]
MSRLLLITLLSVLVLKGMGQKSPQINLSDEGGHALIKGASGFNVRIADKVWSYTHPDFIAAVDSMKPGWLRYFSGTMGDAFNAATGLYDYDYAWQFDHQKQYLNGYAFTHVKGPHTVADLYQVLGRVGGKLVVTINGFTETPEIAAELARFCKNNHIEVEAWQFCNEPYFYVPNRDRYWWNDGADYAAKMKPFADSIRAVFPDAKLALNFTWDGIWGFMREIHSYQEEEGRYWNVFSKHSYAPHIGGRESAESAYRRGNTKLIQATSLKAMKQIEDFTWEGVPLMVTEFGTWNRALSRIYSAVYNAEYTLRQLEHENAFLIGSHEISNKAHPAKGWNDEVLEAFRSGKELNTDSLRTGIRFSDEGKAIYLVHQATNQSDFTFKSETINGPMVPGMKGAEEKGWYARGFKGVGAYDYLVICNRSGETISPAISYNGKPLDGTLEGMHIFNEDGKGRASEIMSFTSRAADFQVKPYSVTFVKWAKEQEIVPTQTRIFSKSIAEDGAELKWWKLENVKGYQLKVTSKNGTDVLEVGADVTNYQLEGLQPGERYEVSVSGFNDRGEGKSSTPVSFVMAEPASPAIFKTARRYQTVTLMWRSVPDANGYYVYQKDTNGNLEVHDAGNVFGYRVENLTYDQPYEFWVRAYNGFGEGEPSSQVVITCKEELPIPPRNISAKETRGGVELCWLVQDTINPDVKYKVFRGASPYNLKPIANDIVGDAYLDENQDTEEVYYSVKAYNLAGETNFFASTATVIRSDELLKLEVASIEREGEEFKVKVSFQNFPTDGDVYFGVAISNVSYLNVEERTYFTEQISDNSYMVSIPAKDLRGNDKYAVKALIMTNGAPKYSEPPHRNISND